MGSGLLGSAPGKDIQSACFGFYAFRSHLFSDNLPYFSLFKKHLLFFFLLSARFIILLIFHLDSLSLILFNPSCSLPHETLSCMSPFGLAVFLGVFEKVYYISVFCVVFG